MVYTPSRFCLMVNGSGQVRRNEGGPRPAKSEQQAEDEGRDVTAQRKAQTWTSRRQTRHHPDPAKPIPVPVLSLGRHTTVGLPPGAKLLQAPRSRVLPGSLGALWELTPHGTSSAGGQWFWGRTLGEDHTSAFSTQAREQAEQIQVLPSPRGRAAAHLGGDHDAGVDQEAHGEAWGGPCPVVYTSKKPLIKTCPLAVLGGLRSSHPGWLGECYVIKMRPG